MRIKTKSSAFHYRHFTKAKSCTKLNRAFTATAKMLVIADRKRPLSLGAQVSGLFIQTINTRHNLQLPRDRLLLFRYGQGFCEAGLRLR